MNLFLATWLAEDVQGYALTEAGHQFRLVSYFYMRDEPDNRIEEYLATGENRQLPRGSQTKKED